MKNSSNEKSVLLTRETITCTIRNNRTKERYKYLMHYIGRALLVVYRNQEDEERATMSASLQNGIGFNKIDAEKGSADARYYLQFNELPPKAVYYWAKEIKSNAKEPVYFSRIARYHKQLNLAAIQKLNRQGVYSNESSGGYLSNS